MNRIERMLQELCPEGVEYKTIQETVGVNRGRRLTKSQLSDDGRYEVYHGSKDSILGKFNQFNAPANTVIVINTGGIGGVKFLDKPFWCSDGSFWLGQVNYVNNKFLYYYLVGFEDYFYSQKRIGGVPTIDRNVIEKFEIPIPPLPIQEEIVRILDHFTELTASLQAELQAELQARQEQYKYYKDQLLKLNVAEYRTLGSLSKFRRGSFPQPYGNKDWYDGDGAMPFVQVADIADDKKLVANTKRKISSLAQPMSVFAPKGSIIISLQGSIGKIAITQYDAYIDRTLAIFQNITNDVLPKYFVYQLERIFEIKEKTARGSTIKTITKEEFTNFQIPIPSISEQKRIVFILDKFETLVNDLSKGLPAEIAAVQEQYEYYRNKLLTFNRIQSN